MFEGLLKKHQKMADELFIRASPRGLARPRLNFKFSVDTYSGVCYLYYVRRTTIVVATTEVATSDVLRQSSDKH